MLILLRHVPAAGRTAAATALLTPLAAAVMIPLIVLFARLTGYRTSIPIVLTEIVLAVAGFAATVALARRWSLARPARNTTRRGGRSGHHAVLRFGDVSSS